MKFLKSIVFLVVVILGFVNFTPVTSAQELYPITALGNCRDRKECRLYCEIPKNHAACWSYGVYGMHQVLGDETPETAVGQLGITFPIAELGNCVSVAACKAYCTITQNQAVCRTYGETHGLSRGERLVAQAKAEFGCTTREECSSFCREENNRAACKDFARRYHLKFVVKNRLVEAAKNELGCTSVDQCRAYCNIADNQSKCQALAQRLGVATNPREQLVEHAKEILGCTSFVSCRDFCQNPDNQEKCRNFGAAVKAEGNNLLHRDSGCTTNEECKKACEANPENCPYFPQPSRQFDNPQPYLQQIQKLPPQAVPERRPVSSVPPVPPRLISPPEFNRQ